MESESDNSPICPVVSREWILTKCGFCCQLVDLIDCDKFWDNLFTV